MDTIARIAATPAGSRPGPLFALAIWLATFPCLPPLRGAEFSISAADRNHWAFQPVKRAAVPAQGHPIDHFIRAKLGEAGLKPSARASHEALIRRVTLDLTGLPPTPREVDAFVQASNLKPQTALESLIDRLLASPHYGERWGRHWLDLARFAETNGFEHDAVRPHAWRYRDYVIQAFNDDKPYDRFIREQIAGDELWPRRPRRAHRHRLQPARPRHGGQLRPGAAPPQHAQRHDRHHGARVPRPHHGLRALPRSQVRAALAARLLRAAGVLHPGEVQPRETHPRPRGARAPTRPR